MGTTEIGKNNRKRRNRKQGSAEAAGSEIERSERAGATGPERRIGAAESRNSGMTEDNNQCQYRRQITSVLKQPNLPRKKRFRMDRYDESSPEEKLSSDYICTAQSRITGSHMQSIFPFLCSNREPLPPKKTPVRMFPIANCSSEYGLSSDRAYSMQSRGNGVHIQSILPFVCSNCEPPPPNTGPSGDGSDPKARSGLRGLRLTGPSLRNRRSGNCRRPSGGRADRHPP